MEKHKISYGDFIAGAKSRMFTDDQVNFLWDMFAEMEPKLENY